jgi:hypothetical protein
MDAIPCCSRCALLIARRHRRRVIDVDVDTLEGREIERLPFSIRCKKLNRRAVSVAGRGYRDIGPDTAVEEAM